MNEKQAIEYHTDEAFLEHYNRLHSTSFRIVEHGDAPDIIARDDSRTLQLEIVLTEDRAGAIKAAVAGLPNPFDQGVWIINRSKDRVFQIF